jgi:hypothetical protein
LHGSGQRLAAPDRYRPGRHRARDQQRAETDKPSVDPARLFDQLARARTSRLTIAPSLTKDRFVTNLFIVAHHDSPTPLTCDFATVIVAAGGEGRGKFAISAYLSLRIGNPSL